VRIIANSAVVDRINKVYQDKIDKWKKILGSGATSHVVAIEKFDGNFIEFESSKIEVIKNIQGDTDENTMLWIPGQRILISGDVSFNGMHVYTAETDSKARVKWLNSINKIRELKPSVVIAGHSKVGAPLDASTAVDFTENYLLVFEEELTKAKDPDSLINTMKERFPSADLLLAIERGAKANVGATFAAKLTPAQKIDRVTTLLKSLETRDPRPLAYIGPRYTQHNLRVADGPAALNELVLNSPAGTTVHTVRIFADGDYVVAQTDYNFGGPKVGFDVFRFSGDKMVEHWDNLQDKCAVPNASGRTQLDGPTKVADLDKTDANKLLMKRYFDDVVLGGQRDKVAQYRSADNFHQHNCDGEDNKSGFQIFTKPGLVLKYTKVHKILGQGNFVLVMSEGLFDAKPTAFYDLYRIENGKQAEHWDVLETIPPSDQWKNPNGKF
jgi:predicted SnoaL-like aldol condensation-catalyzing enzyme/glyoxylase-like metal-dependent hydrolase (beta-lactamase superfamily II)